MSEQINDSSPKRTIKLSVILVLVIIAALVAISWLMTRGVQDNTGTNNVTPGQPIQNDANHVKNPSPTGGSTGTGNHESNDPGVQTPSPAGGVDTNQVPAGEASPAP